MNDHAHLDFDPCKALAASRFDTRVQATDYQCLLDITAKERTSVLPWKGQFSPQLVEYLLSRYATSGETILDPFCGSGTVLYEAARRGVAAIGLDINPAAICLAKVANICALDGASRARLVREIELAHSDFLRHVHNSENCLKAAHAASVFASLGADQLSRLAIAAYLMVAFGDNHTTDAKRINRALTSIVDVINNLPECDQPIQSSIGDARTTTIESESIGYVITSPPYINVFNYHQNYRPITEAFGFKPLAAAKTEIGSNRKFRQNRFMTVVQYCMDLSLMFVEMSRVLRQARPMTIVLGRESNVRSVAFRNGELVSAIAVEGMGFSLVAWNERKFLNRYGAVIYEDVITMTPKQSGEITATEIGRAVGRQALKNALNYCINDRHDEIEEAVYAADGIDVSQHSFEATHA